MAFYSNRLFWPVDRAVRSFRIYVVEPYRYAPDEHAAVFNAAINSLVSPVVPEVSDSTDYSIPYDAGPFDLVTFPEAFLPVDAFLAALEPIAKLPRCGCVHVGLRPSSGEQHLFKVSELKTLVEKIGAMPGVENNDLSSFKKWIDDQSLGRLFNLGCVFAVDADRRLRVCLHPKIIKSKFEIGMLHENSMTEADLLTLISLVPRDKRFLAITIQPLLCSDALNGDTDRPGARPLYAVNEDNGACFGEMSTDHIDVVSLATCTPQPEYGIPQDSHPQWHPAFQETFYRAASDDALWKHHHAVFAFSNFRMVAEERSGGLSGGFIPVSLSDTRIPEFISVSVWGRPETPPTADKWSAPNEAVGANRAWRSHGYIASLRPTIPENAARMIGFTVNKLPRQASRWRTHNGLTDFQLFVASMSGSCNTLTFKQQVY